MNDRNAAMLRLLNLQPGQTTAYHVGVLAADRGPEHARIAEVNDVAEMAWRMYERGEVALTQKRIDDAICAYLATGLNVNGQLKL
jgi:hypothetical protein